MLLIFLALAGGAWFGFQLAGWRGAIGGALIALFLLLRLSNAPSQPKDPPPPPQ